jgi:catechol 2,3-dioxygenase-like lactoylglutathione lyase family enzyme
VAHPFTTVDGMPDDPPLIVTGLDHIVLNVADVERSLSFYVDQLGLQPVRVEEWRRQQVPFPSARVDASTIIDLLRTPRTGENANHFCLVVDPTDFDSIKASGRFEVVDGPGRRYGAQGDGTSLYVRDPDDNVVELRYYGEP